ncbi:MAG TPA: bifunctional riboflavin kinase/FAD synthetase [Planctomycetes bacterium]|nr:bifunctional riboflavin kinase/FAD synthetase [Fuerstiella sp.]HIK91670.1 bifunctional riboflavin kinase/FAD synthetase [Planctomycetota bacterium]
MMPSEAFEQVSATGGIVTIGNFDGVHRGHQSMLSAVCQQAGQRSLPTVVVTFDPHPLNVLKPEVSLPRLSTVSQRRQLLQTYGADEVVVLPVTSDLLDMTPEQFFCSVVRDQLHAVGIVEGPDFRFGKDRAGDIDVLRGLCEENSIVLTVIAPILTDQQMISSTMIRRLLADGKLAAAVELLGHPYSVSGNVVRGAGRGRDLGFPTANIVAIEVMSPADGVYAGVTVIGGTSYRVAVSIGPNPTFSDESHKVECHVLDFTGNLYEAAFCVDLVSEIRSLHPFEDAESLTRQITADIARCREIVAL